MRFDSQVRVQEEDETSLPHKIPPSFSFYRCTVWRGHTPWTVVLQSTSVAHIVRRGCLTEVLYGNTSCDSTSLRHCFHPRS